ncbi:hypothetical protein BJ508DRAFT_417746 [Ascobolus immersus RN42]|uniref:Uncharacterized protein n=1 Tax=Ascobolus immersus RN42 TaxID=1160509 RepID=A0A3N4HSP4_ASCIM|nr:hypothetical protein BJ508DRAFT_417746 [Ascobolus immersus RN42]
MDSFDSDSKSTLDASDSDSDNDSFSESEEVDEPWIAQHHILSGRKLDPDLLGIWKIQWLDPPDHPEQLEFLPLYCLYGDTDVLLPESLFTACEEVYKVILLVWQPFIQSASSFTTFNAQMKTFDDIKISFKIGHGGYTEAGTECDTFRTVLEGRSLLSIIGLKLLYLSHRHAAGLLREEQVTIFRLIYRAASHRLNWLRDIATKPGDRSLRSALTVLGLDLIILSEIFEFIVHLRSERIECLILKYYMAEDGVCPEVVEGVQKATLMNPHFDALERLWCTNEELEDFPDWNSYDGALTQRPGTFRRMSVFRQNGDESSNGLDR